MNFEIKLHPDAVKFLIDLSPETKERLMSGIRSLGIDPFKSRSHADIKKLKGTKKRDDLYPELRLGSTQSFSLASLAQEDEFLAKRHNFILSQQLPSNKTIKIVSIRFFPSYRGFLIFDFRALVIVIPEARVLLALYVLSCLPD